LFNNFLRILGNEKQLEVWPSEGRIEFKNMSLYYVKDAEPAINELSLVIEGGQKVRI